MAKHVSAVLTKVSVSLPFGIGTAEWEPDPTERNAAWSLYIELVTRIAVQSLEVDQGTVREAMNSLYSLFSSTREILKQAGPKVGISHNSVGGIAIAVLNNGLRPFLSKWHPLLKVWEDKRSVNTGTIEHEKTWTEEPKLRQELEILRSNLEKYSDALAEISGVGK